MELVESFDLNEYAGRWSFADLSVPVRMRILADGDTGEMRIYDPFDPAGETYYVFYADKNDLPLRGDWVALRTNGIVLSFAEIGAY
jgi:hypothetical protein